MLMILVEDYPKLKNLTNKLTILDLNKLKKLLKTVRVDFQKNENTNIYNCKIIFIYYVKNFVF